MYQCHKQVPQATQQCCQEKGISSKDTLPLKSKPKLLSLYIPPHPELMNLKASWQQRISICEALKIFLQPLSKCERFFCAYVSSFFACSNEQVEISENVVIVEDELHQDAGLP